MPGGLPTAEVPPGDINVNALPEAGTAGDCGGAAAAPVFINENPDETGVSTPPAGDSAPS